MYPKLLSPDTGILVVDWQTRLCDAMPDDVVAAGTRNVTNLLTLADRMDLPVVATEQYPKGLGSTIEPVAALLPRPALAKTAFSAMRDDAARAAIAATGRRTFIVVGIEAHICVFQTVRDLVAAGYTVQVPGDAVISRTAANWRNGLELCERAGGLITNTETALFDLLEVGRGEVFKEVSRLIR